MVAGSFNIDRDINSAKNILRFGHETLELCSFAA